MWYFAYGSNMETATLRGRRGIEFARALPARVAGWRLVLDKPAMVPIGESFANLVPDPAAAAFGVVYEVTAAELEHIDRSEGVAFGNYRRAEIQAATLEPGATQLAAVTLVSDRRDPSLRPSRRYMAHVIAGAVEHGLPADYVAFLRGVETCEEGEAARLLRPLIDRLIRRTDRPG